MLVIIRHIIEFAFFITAIPCAILALAVAVKEMK